MPSIQKISRTLLYAFIFLLPLQTRWIFSPATYNGAPWEYATLSLYFTQLIALACIFTALAWLIVNSKEYVYELKRIGVIAAATALTLALPIIIAPDFSVAVLKGAVLLMVVLLVLLVPTMKPNWKTMAWCFIAAMLGQSMFAVVQWLTQSVTASTILGMAAQSPDTLGVPVVETSTGRILRVFGTLPHPNILGGYVAVGLLIATQLYQFLSKKLHRNLLLIAVLFMAVTMCMSGSRSAIIAAVLGMITMIIINWKQEKEHTRRAFQVVIMFMVVAALFTFAYPDIVSTRLNQSTRIEQQSSTERVSGYKEATTLFRKNWIVGVGLGNYTQALQATRPGDPAWAYQPVHNVFALFIIEMGLLPLLIAGIYGWLLMRESLSSFFTKQHLGLIAVLTALGLFDHYLFSLWAGVALVLFVLTFIKMRTIDVER